MANYSKLFKKSIKKKLKKKNDFTRIMVWLDSDKSIKLIIHFVISNW